MVARRDSLRSLRVEGISVSEGGCLDVLGKDRLTHLEELILDEFDENLFYSLEYLRLGGWPTLRDGAPDWWWMARLSNLSCLREIRLFEGQFRHWNEWGMRGMFTRSWHPDMLTACRGSEVCKNTS